MNRTRIALTLGGLVVSTLLGCSHSGNGSTPAGQIEATVVLRTGTRTVRVRVEVARTPEERSRGLMFRRKLAEEQGMFFIMEKEEVQSFWMKNTYLPLDMLFIDEGLEVVGLVENAEPLTTVSRRVDLPSRYVLEVNAGFARRHGIGKGTRVVLEGVK